MPSAFTPVGADPDEVRCYLEEHRAEFRAELAEWVAIPSVAGMPEHTDDVRRSADWLVARCEQLGFPTAEVWESGDSVGVFAEWIVDPDLPTALVYGHHDVRAAKAEEWTVTSPFQPALRGDRLYGRGSSDAKGQLLAHLWAIRAHLDASGDDTPAVNLRLIVEGEEELGSPHFRELLEEHRDRLSADVIVFSDTLQWRAGEPALCTSVRGMIGAELEIRGPLKDIHSGASSGPAPNPAITLATLIAALQDESGRIAFPGFYDDVIEISPQRRAELAALEYSDDDWLDRTHTETTEGEAGYSVLERLWERPSLEVVSLLAGDPLGMPRAVIPSAATVSLSIRTVEGQRVATVADQLRSFVEEHVPDGYGYGLSVAEETGQEPYRTPETWHVDALDRAMRIGYRVTSVGRMGNAGGGPADLLATLIGAPVLFFGTGLPEDYWHDSDESADLREALAGAATLAQLWLEIAAGPQPDDPS
ncbi:M20/M25/M40 family metallo-hydrolase [Labedella phragmitis]|uniref:M20/M25/M40 family metallo-hydrolase n=1 Tax=Labedella phragmitis TaxID=2498849 RepID=A0A3S4DK42_9MICO|nr:M20/M25/M40 family metallo-hydrolase [Labedella phragmitis]RWZ53233.1 M20/M25/M40 family metallo-hydrolase [Labedella phragmitis]